MENKNYASTHLSSVLHRKDTKTLYLRNRTQLPVAWRLNGLENLGDDFSVSQESGRIEPMSEFPLHGYFRAMKPVNINKKSIRLEVRFILCDCVWMNIYNIGVFPLYWRLVLVKKFSIFDNEEHNTFMLHII